jgi:hypothetical protein
LDNDAAPILPSTPRFAATHLDGHEDFISDTVPSVQSKAQFLEEASTRKSLSAEKREEIDRVVAWVKSRPEPTIGYVTETLKDDRPWTLWYHDTFDREAEPSLEWSGRGMIDGLAELWGRFLHEGLEANERATFTDFTLHLGPQRIHIDRSTELRAGAAAMKRWIDQPGERRVLAEAHAALGDAGSTELLRLAADAADEPALHRRLAEIADR